MSSARNVVLIPSLSTLSYFLVIYCFIHTYDVQPLRTTRTQGRTDPGTRWRSPPGPPYNFGNLRAGNALWALGFQSHNATSEKRCQSPPLHAHLHCCLSTSATQSLGHWSVRWKTFSTFTLSFSGWSFGSFIQRLQRFQGPNVNPAL